MEKFLLLCPADYWQLIALHPQAWGATEVQEIRDSLECLGRPTHYPCLLLWETYFDNYAYSLQTFDELVYLTDFQKDN